MNQKIDTKLGVVIIIIITIIAGVFVWKCEENKSIESELQDFSQAKQDNDSTTMD